MIVLDLDERLEILGTKARELVSYTSLRINEVGTHFYHLALSPRGSEVILILKRDSQE